MHRNDRILHVGDYGIVMSKSKDLHRRSLILDRVGFFRA